MKLGLKQNNRERDRYIYLLKVLAVDRNLFWKKRVFFHLTSVIALALIVVLVTYFSGNLFPPTMRGEVESIPGPIDVFPLSYLPSCNGTVVGADRINDTHATTRVSNEAELSLEKQGTDITEIYQRIITTDQFLRLSEERRWVITNWDYLIYNGRPAVVATIVLTNQSGTIDRIHPSAYYYLDSNSIEIMENTGMLTSCPAS